MRKMLQDVFGERAADGALRGAFAGIAGGVVFGTWLAERGMFPVIASLVGGRSALLGLTLHLGISAWAGVSFGMTVSRLAEGFISSLLWGMVHGFGWWFMGPLTLMPVMMGMGTQWTAAAVAATVPSLIWHLIFGGVMGITHTALAAGPAPALATRS